MTTDDDDDGDDDDDERTCIYLQVHAVACAFGTWLTFLFGAYVPGMNYALHMKQII